MDTSMVAATLPADNSTWAASGFVTVRTTGGSPALYVPLREPVVTLDFWAVKPGSTKPPWYQANGLAELVDVGTRASNVQRTVTLPTGYNPARVYSAYFVQEPRRAYGDQGDYAHYVADLALHWVDAG
jgi:hypothetical protein